ncbi:MAG: GTP cyclohydrolase FolE2 [Gammaproteobacteria bacterium]|nr:GTP cyclohydrolase FolE2 [Gammaproteobacteria bacterium]
MNSTSASVTHMPDIASSELPTIVGKLDWVGMNDIEMPVTVVTSTGDKIQCPARINAFVNLADPDKQGIHMSRLYLLLDETLQNTAITPATLKDLVSGFLDSHSDLSDRAMVRIDFDYLVRRPSLVSDNTGWRRYPVSLIGEIRDQQFHLEMSLRVLYSSTCPCSAALSRQLVQQKFANDFARADKLSKNTVFDWLGAASNIIATPHSQRSAVDLRVRFVDQSDKLDILDMVELLEGALKTAVQSAVKREDEQAFANLNGTNLMFCEDAARRVKAALESDIAVADYWARCSHFESLHPHNAVAIVTKEVKGGYAPIDNCHDHH